MSARETQCLAADERRSRRSTGLCSSILRTTRETTSTASGGRLEDRTGRGRSLMFLQPSEVGFLKHLKEARVPVVEFEFPAKRIVNVQSQLEKLIGQNYYLNKV